MSGPNKNNNPAEDLMAALLKEVGGAEAIEPAFDSESDENPDGVDNEPLELLDLGNGNEKTIIESNRNFSSSSSETGFDSKTSSGYEDTHVQLETKIDDGKTQLTQFEMLEKSVAPLMLQKQNDPEAAYDMSDELLDEPAPPVINHKTEILQSKPVAPEFSSAPLEILESEFSDNLKEQKKSVDSLFGPSSEELPITYLSPEAAVARAVANKNESQQKAELSNETVALHATQVVHRTTVFDVNDRTVALQKDEPPAQQGTSTQENERTLAVTGFKQREVENHDDKVKVAIGQNRSAYSSGYASWGGGSDVSLGHAENLRMAQEKILDLEKENEKLRIQNEELLSASEIIKERSDLLTAQVSDYKSDRDGLEESFKNEIALLKGHLHRKDVENQKAQIKIDDLDSRLKFDMKKIRIRERELENRLELVRAEKNALMKSKDDHILDLRRKMDVLQMEVDSYRQKCVELNKSLEVNQDSFKRTTRALRLAMANLELQEENKVSLKKVD